MMHLVVKVVHVCLTKYNVRAVVTEHVLCLLVRWDKSIKGGLSICGIPPPLSLSLIDFLRKIKDAVMQKIKTKLIAQILVFVHFIFMFYRPGLYTSFLKKAG